jgi:hypothetical protein
MAGDVVEAMIVIGSRYPSCPISRTKRWTVSNIIGTLHTSQPEGTPHGEFIPFLGSQKSVTLINLEVINQFTNCEVPTSSDIAGYSSLKNNNFERLAVVFLESHKSIREIIVPVT